MQIIIWWFGLWLDSAYTTSVWPEYNGDMKVAYARDGNSFSSSLEGGLGDDRRKRIGLTASVNDKSDSSNRKYDGFAKFELPYKVLYEITITILESE